MSTENIENENNEEVVENKVENSEESLDFYKEKFEFWKAQSRKNEAAFKQASENAKKWEDFEKDKLPEYEALALQNEELNSKIKAIELKTFVDKSFQEAGLPEKAKSLITGNSQEEIEESISKLSAVFVSQEGDNSEKEESKKKEYNANPLQGLSSQEDLKKAPSSFELKMSEALAKFKNE